MALCLNSVQIDDFNDSIVYSGPWQAVSGADYGFNGTRHVATAPGLSANFKFNGSCLFVNGIVGTNGSFPMPPTTFVLDGHFTQMNGTVTDGAAFPGTDFAQAVFYIALTMSDGPHELIVTNLGGNGSVPLMLDGFIITPSVQQDTTSSSAAPASTTSSSSSSSSSSTHTAAATHPAVAASPSSHSHTGAIAGGVVGGVLGLVALVALGFFAWRQHLKRRGGAASDIRPFAAWRGDSQAVLPTTAGGHAEKHPIAQQAPGPAPSTSGSGSGPSEPGAQGASLLATAGNPDTHFYGDSKARPPDYAP